VFYPDKPVDILEDVHRRFVSLNLQIFLPHRMDISCRMTSSIIDPNTEVKYKPCDAVICDIIYKKVIH